MNRRMRRPGKPAVIVGSVIGSMLILATSSLAVVPATVDSYGGNSFAGGVHVIAGTNNLSNFEHGAIGNRYPLAQAGQDISPASNSSASINDYGPLIGNVSTTDCNKNPPPPPAPQPSGPDYCLQSIQTEAPYAKAQYPPLKPEDTDQTVSGPHGSGTGTARARAEELKAFADASYTGSPNPGASFTNSTAHSETSVGANGAITVKTHSHVGAACFGVCTGPAAVNYVLISDTDVQTIVTAINGRATPDALVTPGQVTYCATPATCQPVAVDNNGATVGPASNVPQPPCPPSPIPCPAPGSSVPIPGTGGSAETTVFKIRTVNPHKETNNGTGSVDAVGLDIEVRQPGNAEAGIPDMTIEYIVGEGHSDGFAQAPLSLGGGLDLSNGGNFDTGPVSEIINDVAGGNAGTTGGSAGSSPVKKSTVPRGTARATGFLSDLLRPPFILWFYAWEASALVAAGALVWARRRRLKEMLEEAA